MKDSLFDEVEERTQLAFTNKMEMLIFFLNDDQRYGINVFKIVEVIECPKTLVKMPHSHSSIKGAIDFRGKPIVAIDLAEFLGLPSQDYEGSLSYIIISEYNNNIQGFLVKTPDTLITRNWEEIKSPTGILASSGYLVAIAYTDNGEMIQLLDIERILGEIIGIAQHISDGIISESKMTDFKNRHVLIIDDSNAARQMTEAVISQLGLQHTVLESATSALEMLLKVPDAKSKYSMIICDIEMPGMDGFTFTRKIREHPALKDLYILLHSSMSNPSNRLKAEQVGANHFQAKFKPDELAQIILHTLQELQGASI